MHYERLFPSKYLKAADLEDRDIPIRMRHLHMEPVQNQDGETEEKPVLHFHGTDKRMVLNKTNADTIAGLHGADIEAWRDQPITLFVQHNVQAFGKSVDAIRIRPQAAPAATGEALATTQPDVPTSAQAQAAERVADALDGSVESGAPAATAEDDDLPF